MPAFLKKPSASARGRVAAHLRKPLVSETRAATVLMNTSGSSVGTRVWVCGSSCVRGSVVETVAREASCGSDRSPRDSTRKGGASAYLEYLRDVAPYYY